MLGVLLYFEIKKFSAMLYILCGAIFRAQYSSRKEDALISTRLNMFI